MKKFPSTKDLIEMEKLYNEIIQILSTQPNPRMCTIVLLKIVVDFIIVQEDPDECAEQAIDAIKTLMSIKK